MMKKWKHHLLHKMKHAKGFWFHIAGIISLFWVLFRVLPAPHRSQYPCQQIAIPIAFGYIAFWSALMYGAVFWIKKIQTKASAILPAFLMIFILVFSITGFGFADPMNIQTLPYDEWNPIPKDPMGIPQGINPGRVVWVWDQNATEKELDGYWFEPQNNDQETINAMFSNGLQTLTDSACDRDSWNVLFTDFNLEKHNELRGYQLGEKIAIKINLNNCWNAYSYIDDYTHEDNERDAHPAVVKSLLYQLTSVVGIPQSDITVYDASRPMPNWFYDPVASEYPNVHYVDAYGGASGRTQVQASDDKFYFADGVIRTLPVCVVEADYLIDMPLLKQHPINHGVTLSGKNFFGSFIEPVSDIHNYHISGQTMGNPAPQVDLLGSDQLGGKTVLFIGDGLYATLNDHRTIYHFQMYPFNDDWTNSLFFSQDPIAIDSVMYDFLHTEGPCPIEGSQNYLHQAAVLKENYYDPEHDGTYLSGSLGVHEHWDTSVDIFSKERYSGVQGSGIDFVALGGTDEHPSIVITKPAYQHMYFLNQERSFSILWHDFYTFTTTIVFGSITVEVETSSNQPIDEVAFMVDGSTVFVDDEPPYTWDWNQVSFGTHLLNVATYKDGQITASADRELLKLF